ncbi:CpaF family protein [Sneathiella sp. P13V-1]|uniref:CpaF family protein n=1 Tax=Sneathiella sp. P13V-1 TaxID=2697366 RepID=UPI00187BBF5E|nr:CpaF family protein [Sneathiella sp. P13V-1]MBE7637286.1 CpaF family protein [Sneathiella sp. P13V-1]
MFGKRNSATGLTEFAEENDEYSYENKREDEQGSQSKIARPLGHMETIRGEFFERVNPTFANGLSNDQLLVKINEAVEEIVESAKLPINWKEQTNAALELLNDIVGLGPIETLLDDKQVTDVLINGYAAIFVERNGLLEKTDMAFRDEHHLLNVAKRIALTAGRRVDESSPMVDARLIDGSRVNIIIPPLSVHGTIISIRKFPNHKISLNDLVAYGAMSEDMMHFLKFAAKIRLNILISGGTGSGKTTILNALSGCISEGERIVTIEDAAEINLQQPHVISLETRQRNMEGGGEVSQRDLLRNALRMRPDRIIIGEVRGPESHEMLQAMNTGHDGSMSTVHANSPRDAMLRVEDLVLSYQSNFNPLAVRRQIGSALDLVIHVVRDFGGRRYVQSISEVQGMENDVITMQELFVHDITSTLSSSDSGAGFITRRVRPHCALKAKSFGLEADVLKLFRGAHD